MNETPPRRNGLRRWLLVAAGVGVPVLLIVAALFFPARVPEIDRESVPRQVRENVFAGKPPVTRIVGSLLVRRRCGIDAFFYPIYDERLPVLIWVTSYPQTHESYYVFIPRHATDTYFIYIVPDGTDTPRAKFEDGGA